MSSHSDAGGLCRRVVPTAGGTEAEGIRPLPAGDGFSRHHTFMADVVMAFFAKCLGCGCSLGPGTKAGLLPAAGCSSMVMGNREAARQSAGSRGLPMATPSTDSGLDQEVRLPGCLIFAMPVSLVFLTSAELPTALNSQDSLGCRATCGKGLRRKRRGFQGELGWEMLLVRGLGPCKPHFLGIAFARSMSRVGWGALHPQRFRGGQSEPPTLSASRPFIVHCLLLPPGRMLKTSCWCLVLGERG